MEEVMKIFFCACDVNLAKVLCPSLSRAKNKFGFFFCFSVVNFTDILEADFFVQK